MQRKEVETEEVAREAENGKSEGSGEEKRKRRVKGRRGREDSASERLGAEGGTERREEIGMR